jgi:hypothetical protein
MGAEAGVQLAEVGTINQRGGVESPQSPPGTHALRHDPWLESSVRKKIRPVIIASMTVVFATPTESAIPI